MSNIWGITKHGVNSQMYRHIVETPWMILHQKKKLAKKF
jgi:hypothetical protein